MTLHKLVERTWYGDSALRFALLPLSWIYGLIVALRSLLYRFGALRTLNTAAPVIVVGNITAGGTGKTPIVIWLVNAMVERGFRVAVVARGYGGTASGSTVTVSSASDPHIVGDEPVLIAIRTGVPVYINADRYAAAAQAVDEGADVVVADDGLQHFRLGRRVELAVVDTARGFGNGLRIPAGPLRESVSRLASVDRVLLHGEESVTLPAGVEGVTFTLRASSASRISDGASRSLEAFADQKVHAIAGIGNPERFFAMLTRFGIDVHRHPFPDHATMTAADFSFQDELAVLMTEKDGVKCPRDVEDCWAVPVSAVFSVSDEQALLDYVMSSSGLDGERP